MTAHDTATSPAETAAAAAAGPELGELLFVDPATLVIGTNTRVDVTLDAHFVASIRDHGVREPITVRRRDDGALVVRKGQRRTLAAVKVGLPRVRVLVEAGNDPHHDDTRGQVERIVDQLTENFHRAAITDADEVRAHQQLLELGLSAAQIARRTRTPARRVRATTRVAASRLATAVLDRYDLTLDQAAVIAEFDDGTDTGTETVKALTVIAAREPDRFAHAVQRARDERAAAAVLAAAVADLTAAGHRVITEDQTPEGARGLAHLRPSAADPRGTRLTTEAHAACPGHAVQVRAVGRGWGAERQFIADVVGYCLDPVGHGHADLYDPRPATSTSNSYAGLSEAEKEIRRAEKRRVIAHNKAWDSAVSVRREWLRSVLLARKSAPKDAARYVTTVLAQGGHDLRKAMEGGNRLACELLGLPTPTGYSGGRPTPIAAQAATATPAKAAMLTLALVVAAAEDNLHRHSWRQPTPEATAYMSALKSWGYPLCEVEELVIDPAADTPGDQHPSGADAATETPDGPQENQPGPEPAGAAAAAETGGPVEPDAATDQGA